MQLVSVNWPVWVWMLVWLVVCSFVLTLKQTGNQSRVHLTSQSLTAGIVPTPSDLELDNQKRMDGWCVQEDRNQKQKLQTITFPAPCFNFLSRASCFKRPDFCPYIHWTSNWGLLASMPFVHEFPYSHVIYFKESPMLLYSCSLSRTKRKPEPTCQRFTKQRFHLWLPKEKPVTGNSSGNTGSYSFFSHFRCD